MAKFQYRAYTPAGTIAQGIIQASSRDEALHQLHGQGLLPFQTEEARSAVPWWNKELSLTQRKLSAARLGEVTREWATLLGSGLPLVNALKIAATHSSSGTLKRLNERLLRGLQEGASFSAACGAQDGHFPGYYLSLLRAGETSGSLEKTIQDLAQDLDRAAETKARLTSALIYPSVLLVVAFIVMAIFAVLLLPTIAPLLAENGQELPFGLNLIQSAADIVRVYWPILMLALGAVGMLFFAAVRTPALREVIDRSVLNLPLVGETFQCAAASRFASTLDLMLRNGVPLPQGLHMLESVFTNRVIVGTIREATQSVKEGSSLSSSLRSSRVFPETAIALIATGEQAGNLPDALRHISRIFGSLVSRRLDRLAILLPPLLTVVIGLAVGSLMISFMTALLSLNDLALK